MNSEPGLRDAASRLAPVELLAKNERILSYSVTPLINHSFPTCPSPSWRAANHSRLLYFGQSWQEPSLLHRKASTN